ncbi:CoA ester lyase [Thalassotalea sp. M1531]|uniref:CoA ester lyase n=1 Tax=Thalassotalea algicola TaxID=2716224 RepID=A0A7Y0LE65_9GAMM|nr:CoA ester lyase [Thalassotalea algicola]NMP32026.1 CoA ester lyase [Thalassotalea algicola]
MSISPNKLIRSLLFVPGSKPDRFAKADAAGADLICIDLEDAVLPEDKDCARQAVVNYINDTNREVCVRINPIDSWLGQQDLVAIAKAKPAYIMLAKCGSAEQISMAAKACSPKTKLIGLIETIEGLEQAFQIATGSDKVAALMFGGADMSAELRCDFSYQPLLFARSQLVMAAAKAGVDVLDVPFVDIKNEAGLIEETNQIRLLGFTGKAAIHPIQVQAIHDGFTPTNEQLAYAESVMAAVDGPDAGVVVVNGRMVDRPIILASERVLALAQAAQHCS